MTRESANRSEFPASPGLLILTGASHTGKTSVARSILDLKCPPVALLGVDNTLEHILVRPPGNRWSQIPLAYKLLRLQAEELLRKNWFVVLESTFTYVPENGAPEFHGDELEQLMRIALAVGVPCSIVQLQVSEATLYERAQTTNRLPLSIVAETFSLHATAAVPNQTVRVEADKDDAERLARSLLASFPS